MKTRRRNPRTEVITGEHLKGVTLRYATPPDAAVKHGRRRSHRSPPGGAAVPAPAPAAGAVLPKRPAGRSKTPKRAKRPDILAEIAGLGGINKAEAEKLWGAMVKDAQLRKGSRFRPVFRARGGRSVDAMAQQLHLWGYIASPIGADQVRELEELLSLAFAGQRVTSATDPRPSAELEEDEIVDAARRGDPAAQAELELRGVQWNPGRRRRKNPDLLTLSNPTRKRELAQALSAYRKFHGQAPTKAVRVGRDDGRVMVALGELREIVYQPKKGARKGPAFVHAFGRGAVLAASPDGKHLELIPASAIGAGRAFRVDFERGIVG